MSDRERGAVRRVLGIHDFRWLYFGQIVSDFGDTLTLLSVTILISRLVESGSSATAIAGFLIAVALPSLFLGMLAGVYVDRWDKRRVMIASDVLRGVIVLGFLGIGSIDQLWLLYLIGLLHASVSTFFNPARAALIPEIVPPELLLSANSISQTSRVIFNLAGTATAGLIAGFGTSLAPAFILDAITFLASAVLVSRIAARHKPPKSTGDPLWPDFRDGLLLLVSSRGMRGLLLAASVAMLGLGAVNVLLVPFVVEHLEVSEAWFGAIEGSQVIGMVAAGSFVAIAAQRLRVNVLVAVSLGIIGVGIGLVSLVQAPWHMMILLLVVGLGVTPAQSAAATLAQTLVDKELIGRASAALQSALSVSMVLSMAVAGVLASAVGVRGVFVISGVITVVAGIVAAAMLADVGTPPETEADAETPVAVPSAPDGN